ncbi:aminodeoxychorismate/anthranilate synthase component II [Temperatibacter marinus]|uniref:Aminodeoxychorismate/anthranilate synthase component II n=1 Tax=Temperatibacter marinus TaxID=1456591 RepID=A0AA52ECW4_9PROT|nr:aminodeoxychorismate/anthranilate synthase component II [Temperatibacter marinus]WND02370.1 aminodeoxychorismate/anthranilate synthase component II [Temperatibacter marinus]
MFLLIDNYDSFTYNIYHYLRELGAELTVVRNDQISVEEALALNPEGIILSPGPCTPNEAGICLDLIDAAKGNIPILGICLGHQSIGQIYGGDVIRAPYVMHGKTSEIHHSTTGLFDDIPSPYNATRYHSLIIDDKTFPDCLKVTAQTSDGLIMAVEHQDYPLYGVQYHPESIASEHGHKLLKNFINIAKGFACHG